MNYCSMIMSYYIFRASLFIALDGMFFISIYIFPSSMSKNQLVSCMMTFFSLLEFFIDRQVFSNCSKLSNTGFWGTSSGTLYIFHQLNDFCNNIFYFWIITFHISSCLLILGLIYVFVKRRWSSEMGNFKNNNKLKFIYTLLYIALSYFSL